jgi:hypothetical protein
MPHGLIPGPGLGLPKQGNTPQRAFDVRCVSHPDFLRFGLEEVPFLSQREYTPFCRIVNLCIGAIAFGLPRAATTFGRNSLLLPPRHPGECGGFAKPPL